MKQEKSKLPKRLKEVQYLSYAEAEAELKRINIQFCTIHDLPKQNELTALEYMHEALEGLRQRAISLNWRMIEINKSKYETF